MVKKKEKSYPLGFSEELSEGVFGFTAEDLSLPTVPRKKKKKKLKNTLRPAKAKKKQVLKVMPEIEINYDNILPKEAEGVHIRNAVGIPEDLLKTIAANTEKRTKELSDLMLSSSTPSILSFDAASTYAKTVLRDGLNIEVDIDKGVLKVIEELSRMDVIYYFLNSLRLPKHYKRKFMESFIEKLSAHSLEAMEKANKSTAMSNNLRELEGFLVKGYSDKNNPTPGMRQDRKFSPTPSEDIDRAEMRAPGKAAKRSRKN